jgi:glycosyltransferase involved in cell wall biosynthesis
MSRCAKESPSSQWDTTVTDRPPRTVLVAFHEEGLGGAALSVLRVVPLLEGRGWRFIFWASRPSELSEELHQRGAEVYGAQRPVAYGLRTLRSSPGASRRLAALPGYLSALRRLVVRRSPALVHANSLYALAEAAAARSAGAPVLLHVHELVPQGVKGMLARVAARRIAAERIAVSQASAASLKGAATRIIFGGASLPPTPASLDRQPRPFVVGTVGAISARKGSDIFVDAARRVLAETTAIRFRMIGAFRDPVDRGWGNRIVEEARAAGVEHRDVANVERELMGWDAFVLPSRVDPFPLAMLEAMAAGLPVIGTNAGGIPEQVRTGCGILVPPGDSEALARAIVQLARMPWEERAAMGAAARRQVGEHFTLERQAGALDAAYRALTARTATTSS